MGVVTALDVLEHLQDDHQAARELRRVLRPDGVLVVAVPADPELWSAHDDAVGHLRRYTCETLDALLTRAGFEVQQMWSWNVLLRPVAVLRRKKSAGSDLEELHRSSTRACAPSSASSGGCRSTSVAVSVCSPWLCCGALSVR
jgi:SAM-dependent methyltransferase